MLDLALSVLCSSIIFVVFKLFPKYKVQTIYAIVVNYFVASISGWLFNPLPLNAGQVITKPWFIGTIGLGCFFIGIFYTMAKCSQKNGVGVTSVATKMSLVLPVIFAITYYKDALSLTKGLGILLALMAVYLASAKSDVTSKTSSNLWLPILVFLGSGIIDTCIKFIQEGYLNEEEYPLFSCVVFGAAGLTGLMILGIKSIKEGFTINLTNILGGTCLGIANYFSIYFLLRALDNTVLNSSSVFTINNVAIVLFSTLLGIVLFKEKLLLKNWLGVAMAVVSIILVALF